MNKKWLVVANISLFMLAALLTLNLFEVKVPSLGTALYLLDKTEPQCIVNWQKEYTSWSDLDACCFEVRQQLHCSSDKKVILGKEVQWVCQTGTGEVLKYWLNDKAYYYCNK